MKEYNRNTNINIESFLAAGTTTTDEELEELLHQGNLSVNTQGVRIMILQTITLNLVT